MAETKKINATVDLVKSGVEFKLNGGTILSDDGTSHYLHSQSNLYLYSGSSNTMVLTSSGNVGIGTTSPLGKLQVNEYTVGANGNQSVHGELSVFANSGDESLFLGVKNASYPNRGWAFNTVSYGVNSNLQIKEHGSTAVRMTIQSGGNVGIGTTSPSTSLHVVKDASWEVARFEADSYPTATVYSQAAAKYAQLNIYDTRINSEPTMELRADTPHFNIRLDNTGNVLTIRDGGNVGIGTTSPAQKLEVSFAGSVYGARFTRNDAAGSSLIEFANSAGVKSIVGYDAGADAYRIGTPSSNYNLIVKQSGNVGIGTTSPDTKFHVNVASDADYVINANGRLKVKGDGTLWWGLSADYGKLTWDTGKAVVRGESGKALSLGANGSQDAIYINTSQNVGVGTTAPNHKLDIYSNENVPLRIHRPSNANLNSSGAWGIGFSTRGDAITSTSDTRAGIFSYYNGNLFLAAANTSIVADPDAYARLTILNSGNVGIGTTSPGAELHVKGAGEVFRLQGDTGQSYMTFFQGTGGRVGYLGTAGSAGIILESSDQLQLYAGSSEVIRITSSGNVGIGTTSPAYKLDVVGTMRIAGNEDATNLRIAANLSTVSGTAYQNYNELLFENTGITYGNAGIRHLGNAWLDGKSALAFFTSSNIGSFDERMRIDASGSVGIGTTSPGAKLDITTDHTSQIPIRVTHNNYNDWLIQKRRSDDTQKLGIKEVNSNGGMGFATADTVRMVIDSSGNVGIGTTTPGAKTEIQVTSTADQELLRLTVNPADALGAKPKAILGFYTPAEANTTNYKSGRISSKFDTNGYANSRVTIESLDSSGNFIETLTAKNGNVGIGTTTISGQEGAANGTPKLQVLKTGTTGSYDLVARFGTDQDENNSGASVLINAGNDRGLLVSAGRADSNRAIAHLNLIQYDGNELTDGLTIYQPDSGSAGATSGTNVGIGTTSPLQKLDVDGNIQILDTNASDGDIFGYLNFHSTNGGSTGNHARIAAIRDSAAAGQMLFYTKIGGGTTEKMRITSAGNVGIGTTSPSEALHIYRNAASAEIRLQNNTISSYIRSNTDNLNFYVSNGEKMRITSTGNVGIGTTSPGRQLELRGQGVIRLNAISGGDPGLDFNTSDVNDMQIRYRSTTDALAIYSYGTSSDVLTIRKSDGNVGIGTTSPDTKLHIYENAAAPVLLTLNNYQSDINPNGSQGNFIDFKMTDDNATFTPQVRIGMIVKDSDGDSGLISEGCGNFVVYTAEGTDQAGNGTLTEHFRITDKGNVGIGTTSPAQKLHVKGHIRADYNDTDGSAYLTGFGVEFERGTNYLRPRAADGTQTLILGGGGDTLDWNNIQFKTSGYINFRMSGSDVFRINSSGNVGIGTTSPGRKLHVDNASGVGEAVISGTTGATLYFRPNASYSAAGNFGIFTTGLTSGTYESTMIIKGYSSAITDVMTIKGSGNVGIGTTSPSYNLDVNGNINATGFYIGGINQIAGTEYIAPLARTGTWTRDAGTSPSDEWVKVISYNGGPRRIRLWLNHGGDNTNMYDEYLISHSSYGMQTHIYRLPGSKYNTSKVLGIKVINSSGAVQDVWVKLAGIASGSGSFVYRSNVTVESSTNVAASATATEPSGTTGSSVLYISDSNRNEFTTMSSGGGYFGGNISIGTASPTANLHITSSGTPIKMSRSGYDDYGFVQSAGTGLQIQNFTDNRTEMFFDGGGNIGMGTTSPKSQLHIYKSNTGGIGGELRLDNNGLAVANKTRILFSDAGGNSASFDRAAIVVETENSPYNGQFQFQTGFGTLTTKMIISGAGNVGIGTTGPNQKLHVEGAIYAGTANSTSGSLILVGKYNNGNIITIGGGYSAGGAVIGYGVKPSTTAAGAFLSSSALANLERSAYVQHGSTHQWWTGAYQTVAVDSAATLSQVMTLDGAGKLGIGTTSPNAMLHVTDSIQVDGGNTFGVDNAGHQIYMSSGGSGLGGKFGTGYARNLIKSDGSATIQIGDNTSLISRIVLDAGSSGVAGYISLQTKQSERVRVNGDGNVGIGTTSPSYRLHVDNDDLNTNNPALYVRNPNSSSGAVIAQFVGDSDAIQIKNINVGDYAIYNTQQSNGIALYDGTGGVEIHYNGAAVLEADSNGGIKVTGQLSATGDVVAYSSDERLKENIKPIENAVNKIKQLKGVTFDWNEKSQELGFEPSTKTNDVGVIAQDVEAVFPQLVHLAPFDIGSDEEGKATSKTGEDYKTVNYARLTAVLIEAVKEQQQQIDELKEIINGLTK